MGYLLTQMFLYILGAFLLGLLLGWIIWGRLRGRITELEADVSRLRGDNDRLKRDLDACGKARADLEARNRSLEAELAELRSRPTPAPAPAALMSAPAKAPAPKKAAAPKPAAVKAAPAKPAKPDNLRRMIGIGPVNNKKLNGMGVTTFAQIAKWSAADIKRVEAVLEFDGRIERERWIEQAKLLAAGDEKEFLKRFPTAGTDKNT
jgi:predicted flap endonuclease-1-like 5' DNA nuclease